MNASTVTSIDAVIDRSLDAEGVEVFRSQATQKVAATQVEIDAFNRASQIDVDTFDLPKMVVPDGERTS